MIQVYFHSFKCNEETNEVGADEPYVLVVSVNLNSTRSVLGFNVPLPSYDVFLYGPYEGVDKGEAFPGDGIARSFWGVTGTPDSLSDPSGAIFIVALIENDDGSPEACRGIVKGIVASSLFATLTLGREQIVAALIRDVNSIVKTPTGAPNFDDQVGSAQELKFQPAQLLSADSGSEQFQWLKFDGDGGSYTLAFGALNRVALNIRRIMGAVTVMDTPTSPQRAHVFVECHDSDLWCRWSDGGGWHWTNMGKPPGVNIGAFMGAVTVMDTPTSAQRTHLFVKGGDSNLWCLWSDGGAWNWTNMGKPPGANIGAFMGAVTVMDTPTSPQRAHVFVKGEDSNLWCFWSDGGAWHWDDMGKPSGASIGVFMGAVTVMNTPTSPQRTHVFVKGDDSNLWCSWSDGGAWYWTNMARPSGLNIAELMGAAVTVMNTAASPQLAHVFVECDDSDLWCHWSDGTAWHWVSLGKPQA